MPSDHRLHPSSIFFALAGSLRRLALPAVLLLLTSGRSSPQPSAPDGWGPVGWMNRWMPGDFAIANWQFWILLFLIPATIAAIARYLSFRLHYEGTELVIRSGIVFRNERHVPYARIQNLDAVRNLAHRLLGVAEVRVETGGGKAPEATISVLHETVFEEMRRRVFAERALQHALEPLPEDADLTPQEDDSRTLLYLPVRELVLNGLLDNRGMLVIGALYGVLWEAGFQNVVWDRLGNWYGPGLLRDTALSIVTGNVPSLSRIAILLAGIGGLLLIVRVLSMAWSVLRLHDFRLTRVGDDLRAEYGLTTRITATIPLKRVQSLTVSETPLQRFFGRMSVRVETAGGHGSPHDGQAKQPRERLAPIIRRTAVPTLVHEVLPGFTLDGLDWQPLHPRAFRRTVKPGAIMSVLATIPFMYWFGWAGLAVLPFALTWLLIVGWMHVRHTHWAFTEDVLAYRSGWLWRSLTIVPASKVQAVGFVESPFDRRAAMAGVRVDTAGSAAPMHRISITYLARETAATLYERLAAQTAQTAFRW